MINIAELLKHCPTGMELDCSIYENVTLVQVKEEYDYPIVIETPNGQMLLSKYGCFSKNELAKCVIFPKGKTTWVGFVPPCKFKDGDIITSGYFRYFDAICIFKDEGIIKGTVDFYCGISGSDELVIKDVKNQDKHFGYINEYKLATEEEKAKLFQAIKDNGYHWNTETKTLEKLPKFQVGDNIVKRDSISNSWIVSSVSSEYYGLKLPNGVESIGVLPVSEQDDWELVPNKFDINTLKPFDKVLVRDNNKQEWTISFFSHCNGLEFYKYSCINGCGYAYCIPYESNEHLLGTANDCDDYYKIWE